MVTYRNYFKLKHNLIFWIVLLFGILFKAISFFLSVVSVSQIYGQINFIGLLSGLGDLFIISFGIAIITQIFLKQGEELTLREVLGINETSTLYSEIKNVIIQSDFDVKNRESIFNLKKENKEGFDKMSVFHTDEYLVLVKKDNAEFNFRRGSGDNTKIEKIIIQKIGENPKELVLTEHLQRTPCADLMLYSIVKCNFKKNNEYLIKIYTYAPNCMLFENDYTKSDIIYPQDETNIIIIFPKDLRKTYFYDVRLRGINKFKCYIKENSKLKITPKDNKIQINCKTKCLEGDIITFSYKEK